MSQETYLLSPVSQGSQQKANQAFPSPHPSAYRSRRTAQQPGCSPQLTGVCDSSEDRYLYQQVRSWPSGSHSFRSAQCQATLVPVPRPSETVCPACSYSRGAISHHPCLQTRLPANGSWGQQTVSEPQNRQDLGVKGHKSQTCFHCSPSLSLWRNYPLSEKRFLHLQVGIKPFSVSADSIGG